MPRPNLLEREEYLAEAQRLFVEAADGRGSLLFLSGEAGVGKTSVITEFLSTIDQKSRRLMGSCEPGLTPSPLWPLREMGLTADWAPGKAISMGAPRDEIFHLAHADLLGSSEPTVLIIEDVHWADDSTLDFISFLARRIHQMRVVAIASYRNDDLRQIRSLKIVLGDLATVPALKRMTIAPLSYSAVSQLASGRSADVNRLYERSLGNPFLVNELLAARGAIPESVKDTVFARIGSLSEAARNVLEICAVRGMMTERSLIAATAGMDQYSALDECIQSGMMLEDQSGLVFRHELYRDAILSQLSQSRRSDISGRLFAALESHPADADPALLARLAEEADLGGSVAHYAVAAGDRAHELRSYREASAQYRRAVEFSHQLSASDRSTILHKLAESTYNCGRGRTGIGVLEQLIASLQQTGNWSALAEHYGWLAAILVEDCRMDDARRVIQQAIDEVAPHPVAAIHGEIYQKFAQVLSITGDQQEAIGWGERAADIAGRFGDERSSLRALIGVGTSRLALNMDDPEGIRVLEAVVARARAAKFDVVGIHALSCLGGYFANSFRPGRAAPYVDELIEWSTDCSLDCWRRYGEFCLGISRFYKGDWDAAAAFAPVMSYAEAGCLEGQLTGLLTIGRLRARRGDPDSTTVIDMALGLTPADAPPFMRARLHLARAEAAWLRGDRDTASREAELGLRVAIAGNERFIAGEIAYYVDRAGKRPEIPLVLLEAQARELEQDWLRAAAAWRELGCPYEEARAQFESGDSAALHAAFATFDRLGASPMLTAVKQRLRSLGASIPRGPRSSTRESKFGLTTRESEVVRFAQLGWTNNEIADRLFLSARTVEHHLSSIYDKMGIRSKREVGDRLRETSDQRILQGNIA